MEYLNVFYWITSLLYFLTGIIYLNLFLDDHKIYKRLATFFLPCTIVFHLFVLVLRSYTRGYSPFLSVFEILSILALAITLIYFFLEYFVKEARTTGLLIIPTSFSLQLISSIFYNPYSEPPDILFKEFFLWHIGSAIIAYATFVLAFIYAFSYLILFKNLKQRNFGIVFRRMPSLEHLDNMNLKSCFIGFILFLIAILLGYVGQFQLYGRMFHFDPKVLISVFLWLLYGIQLFGYFILHWGGKRRSYISILGLPMIVFCMVAGNLFTGFHRFF